MGLGGLLVSLLFWFGNFFCLLFVCLCVFGGIVCLIVIFVCFGFFFFVLDIEFEVGLVRRLWKELGKGSIIIKMY